MFKCTECGTEYEQKPSYCDCGNDEFVEENISDEVFKNSESTPCYIQDKESCQNLQENTFAPTNNDEAIVMKSTIKEKVEPISIVIFIICIVLSLFIILFAFNPKPVQELNKKDRITSYVDNVPSIDDIWYDAPMVSSIQEVSTNYDAISNHRNQETKARPNYLRSNSVQRVKPIDSKKNISPVKQSLKMPVVQNKTPKNTKPIVQQISPAPKTVVKPAAKSVDSVAKPKTNLVPVINSQEFLDYKVALRNSIGGKIDFTKVVGDGECEVSFQISKAGKLINRKFEKQSSNITLNDAVYYSILATPNFNPPPQLYKNEKLTLFVKFYNGNFTIVLK